MATRRVWRQILSASVWLFICDVFCIAHEAVPGPAPPALTDIPKPASDAHARPYQERFQALIRARYPKLFTAPAQGIPIVTVLFDPEEEILRADCEVSSKPQSELVASESNFSRYGALVRDLRYIGATSIHLPANTVLVVFAGVGSRNVHHAPWSSGSSHKCL